MAYKNARDVLPPQLIKEIQKYIDGDLIYIPASLVKSEWGKKNGARQKYAERNFAICEQYRSGVSAAELANRYFLSVDSIKKIVYGTSRDEMKKAQ